MQTNIDIVNTIKITCILEKRIRKAVTDTFNSSQYNRENIPPITFKSQCASLKITAKVIV